MNKKTILKISLALSLLPWLVLAQAPTPPEDLWATVKKVVGALLAVVFILGVIFLIIGAIAYITAGGDPAKVENARNLMLYAVIGMGIAVLAWAFMTFIISYLTGWRP